MLDFSLLVHHTRPAVPLPWTPRLPGPRTVEPDELRVHFLSRTGVGGWLMPESSHLALLPGILPHRCPVRLSIHPSRPPPAPHPALFLALLKKSQRLQINLKLDTVLGGSIDGMKVPGIFFFSFLLNLCVSHPIRKVGV